MKIKNLTHLLAISVLLSFVNNLDLVAQKRIDSAKPFIGTSGDNGQVDPGACVPYGMVRVCPDTEPRSRAGYDYSVSKISGFSINRISGIGCNGAGGNISVKPSLKNTNLNIEKINEGTSPGCYVAFLDNNVRAEVTATNNVAIERFHYPPWKETYMTINFGSSFTKVLDAKYELISDTEIQGYVQAENACDHGAYKLYFNLKTNRAFSIKSEEGHEVEISFSKEELKPVEVRIGISPINMETARMENEKVKEITFEQAKKSAENAWENILSRIDIKGGTTEELALFYTSLYRVFLSPANVTSSDNKFLATAVICKILFRIYFPISR